MRPFDIRSFSRFVASSTVPTGTGRNNQLPGRDHYPLETNAFLGRTIPDTFEFFSAHPAFLSLFIKPVGLYSSMSFRRPVTNGLFIPL